MSSLPLLDACDTGHRRRYWARALHNCSKTGPLTPRPLSPTRKEVVQFLSRLGLGSWQKKWPSVTLGIRT